MLLDLHLDGDDGLEVLERLRASGYHGLAFVLSGDNSFAAAHRAARAGADGYLVKGPRLDLPKELGALMSGAENPDALGRMSEASRAYLASCGLTRKELALAEELAADCAKEKAIATRTDRSETAVRKGFESIRDKLGATSQHDLARMIGILSCLGGRTR